MSEMTHKTEIAEALECAGRDSRRLDALERLLWRDKPGDGDNLLLMPYLTHKGERRRISLAWHEDGTGIWDEIADAPDLRTLLDWVVEKGGAT